ncbi:CaiB/BaiF CoA-transferase family protein [uncultured Thiothrix sp.]|uniref:CaiB/BaiF CoA transferase family protein n=1 Tax=uncultured Thiothrix sp. TaxID=223185 RepID=UPI002623BE80|nr:CaiB/BaiF CoA-transferase family protein [uncultured Thiothrix sp.]
MTAALHQLKVIEMAGIGPCPLAGQLLADLGAEVIVIDRASTPADPTDINRRHKRSIALNLKSPEGLKAAQQLIAQADVLIEGFRPGVMEKLGLGPNESLSANPKLIYGRMTGWGQTGPLAQTAGHDLNYLAITGALHPIGAAEQPPVPPLNLAADYGGGTMFLLLGILAALYERNTSGQGQVIDAAMVDGVPAMMGLLHTWFARQWWTTERESNFLDGGAPFYRCYTTADNKYISVAPLEPHFFKELLAHADLPAEHYDSQYQKDNWPERSQQYADIFRKKTQAEWLAIFEGSDACVAPVLDFNQVEAHPHNAARGSFVRVENVLQSAPAPRFSRTPAKAPIAPTAVGGDTNLLLAELGYSPEQIANMRTTGALT